MTTLWRVHLNATPEAGVDQRKYCIEHRVIGVGWDVGPATSLSWDEYCVRALERHGRGGWKVAAQGLREMRRGDICWTRDLRGEYYVGMITDDEWTYNGSAEALDADSVNQRNVVAWHRVGTAEMVPGEIVNRFIRGRTVQRIHNRECLAFSQDLLNDLSETEVYRLEPVEPDLFALMSTDDCEDVIGLYLQREHGLYVVPSTAKRSTPDHEYVLVDSAGGSEVIVQVKTGRLPVDAYRGRESRVVLFSATGLCEGQPSDNVECLDVEEIRGWIAQNLEWLPGKIRRWYRLALKLAGRAVPTG